MEVSRRRGDFAIIGVACTLTLDADGRCIAAQIGLCNAGDGPVFATEACEALVGHAVDSAATEAAAERVRSTIDPGGSIHGSKEFQRHIAGVLTARALTVANERARQ